LGRERARRATGQALENAQSLHRLFRTTLVGFHGGAKRLLATAYPSARTSSTTGARADEAFESVSKVQIEGDNARVDTEMANNPMFSAGTYILVRGSAPKGMFIVNPEKETYSRFDPEELSQAMAPMTQSTEGAGMRMSVDEVEFEKLVEEPGGEIEGLPTTHYRFHKSYVMTMEMANMKMPTAHDIVDDVWVTTELRLGTAGAGSVLEKMGSSEMFEGLQKLAELEQQSLEGFPLKRVSVDHTTPQGKGMMARMMGGKEQTVTTTLLVQDLKRGPIPAATFAIPAGYTETEMMQPGAKAPDLENED